MSVDIEGVAHGGSNGLWNVQMKPLPLLWTILWVFGCSGKESSVDTGFTSNEQFNAWQDQIIAEHTIDVGTADVKWEGSKEQAFDELIVGSGGVGQAILRNDDDFYVLDALPLYDCDPLLLATSRILHDDTTRPSSSLDDRADQIGDLDDDGHEDFVFDTYPLGMTLFYGPFAGDILVSEYDAVFYDQPPDGEEDVSLFHQTGSAVGMLEDGGPFSVAVAGSQDGQGPGEAYLLTEIPSGESWIRDVATVTFLDDECRTDGSTTYGGEGPCWVGYPEIAYVGDTPGRSRVFVRGSIRRIDDGRRERHFIARAP
jgi:hypothetical protein